MKKMTFAIYLLSLVFLSCNPQDSSPLPEPEPEPVSSPDSLIIHENELTFTYESDTEINIDINNDNIYDFQCIAERAGNRIRKLIVPIGQDNKITDADNILDLDSTIGENTVFSDRFDFNDLGAGANAFLDDKFLGVKFQIDNQTHYGWIKFSSEVDGDEDSTTPVYYHNVTTTIKETAYHQTHNQEVTTE